MLKRFQTRKQNLSNSQINNNMMIDEQKPNYAGVSAIAVVMFTIGIGLYLPGGIANPLINTFHAQGVDVSAVNLSMTVYLIGLIIGAILVPLVFIKFKRKFIIIGAMVDYIICNLIIAFSTNWDEFLVFRFLAGCAHGCCIGVATLMAAHMVPKNKRGIAVAVCYSALFASTFTVVPLLTYTSSLNGWGEPYKGINSELSQNMIEQWWRWDFFVVALISIIALLMLCFTIPNSMRIPGKVNIKTALSTLYWWPFLLAVFFDIIIFFGIFVIYPLLQDVWTTPPTGIISGDNTNLLAVLLLVYGVFSLISNQIGGSFTNGRTFPWLYIVTFLFILNIVLLIISCKFENPEAILVFTLLIPVIAYLALPNIYAVCFGLAKHHDKTDSIDFESGVVSAGIGIGAVVGTAIGGPICQSTNNEQHIPQYEPNNFTIILYIVLGVLIFGFLILFPIHWYLKSAELIIVKDNRINRLLNKMPLYIDNYSTQEKIKLVEDNQNGIYVFQKIKNKQPSQQRVIDNRDWKIKHHLKHNKNNEVIDSK